MADLQTEIIKHLFVDVLILSEACYRQLLFFFFFAERQRQQKMGVILRYWSVLKHNSHHHKTKTLTPYYTNESSNQFQASAY